MSAGPLWPQARPARKSWPLRWSQLNSTGKPAGKPLQLYLLLDAAQNRDLLASSAPGWCTLAAVLRP